METKSAYRPLGLSDNPTFDILMWELSQQAGEWRETQSADAVRKYHAVYNCLIALGWADELDLELMLPDDLMPQAYQDRDK